MSETDGETPTFSASIKELLASTGAANTEEKGVLPMLTELADKHEQSSVLIQKAMLMLGLADKFKGTTRGEQLQTDAEEFLSYAKDLQESDEAILVLAKAQKFADTVADKYELHGGHELYNETKAVWDDIMNSGQADEFLSVGGDILKDWDKYGGSTEGKEIIDSIKSQIVSLVDEGGVNILDLVQEYASDADVFLANSDKHKEVLMEALKDVDTIIQEDAELKELLEQGREAYNKALGKTNDEEVDKQTDAVIHSAVSQGQEMIHKLKESDVGKDILAQGTKVLSDLKASGDLDPATVIAHIKSFQEDPKQRQEVINKIKDAVLAYLLDFIPKIKLNDLQGENDMAKFSFNNVDLAGFRLRASDVDVQLIDGAVYARAKNISCHLEKMEWWCKAKKFPYMSSSGLADAVITRATFDIKLDVVKIGEDGNILVEENKEEKEKEKLTDISEEGEKSTEKGENPEKSKNSENVLESALSVFDYNYTVCVCVPDQEGLLATEENNVDFFDFGDMYEDEDDEEYDDGYTSTSLVPRFVRMPTLDIEISGSWFSSLINMLLRNFNSFVKKMVEDNINQILHDKSSELVLLVNNAVKEYLPLVASLKKKVVEKAPKLIEVANKASEGVQENMRKGKQVKSTATITEMTEEEDKLGKLEISEKK